MGYTLVLWAGFVIGQDLCSHFYVYFQKYYLEKKKKNSATGTIISQENLGIKLLPDLIWTHY